MRSLVVLPDRNFITLGEEVDNVIRNQWDVLLTKSDTTPWVITTDAEGNIISMKKMTGYEPRGLAGLPGGTLFYYGLIIDKEAQGLDLLLDSFTY